MLNFPNGIVSFIGAFMGICLFSFSGHPVFAAAIGISVLLLLQTCERSIVRSVFGASEFFEKFKKYDWCIHLVFLFSGAVFIGMRSSIPVFYLLAGLHLIALCFYIFKLLNSTSTPLQLDTQARLGILFFVSGFAALIYQIAWQRALFQVYGVNPESVTIIVSIFMLGLGVGSMIGGLLSKKYPDHSVQLFLGFEIGAALFGIFSLKLIHLVGNLVVLSGPVTSTLSVYLLLSVPTIFMGATLPVLVSYLHKITQNIGRSVSVLYFINTLGSAAASFATVDLLFVFLGLQQTVYLAAFCNCLVALLVYFFSIRIEGLTSAENKITDIVETNEKHYIPFKAALGIAFLTGYISLSQEILWVRAIGFAASGMPQTFGQVLGAVLFGVALGALFADALCKKDKIKPLILISGMLLFSSIAYYFAMPLIANVMVHSFNVGLIFSYFVVALIAASLGGVLIVVSHYGIQKDQQVGSALSWIYMANILGSTCGPLFTGFVLLDLFTLNQNIMGLVLFSVIAAVILTCWYGHENKKPRNKIIASSTVFVLLLYSTQHHFYDSLLVKLQFKKKYTPGKILNVVVENRSGIASAAPDITLNKSPDAHIVSGDGVFDGIIYTKKEVAKKLMADENDRFFIIGELHPHPREVLQIAMSAGSWTQMLSGYEQIDHLDVVELNSGYLDIAKHYPGYDLIARNPKVSIHIDDGRRWLRRNPDRKFDMIVFNTPHHFRSQISSLLSMEFIELCKAHLKPGGVYYQTVTGSEDAIYTGAQNFKYVIPFENMYAASDEPFAMTREQKVENFSKFKYYGDQIFPLDRSVNVTALDNLLNNKLTDRAEEYRANKKLMAVTDDNMLTEYKRPVSRLTQFYKWWSSD
ncbi:MAG: hypothetical protein H7177_06445 [Rhizobacter sp.]|nr:hypothetical protein [Bacteriovorax sp.]